MTAQELTLNIAVNLGRLSRWAYEGKTGRIGKFIEDTQSYLEELEKAPKSDQFLRTFRLFKAKFNSLKHDQNYNYAWADEALTWANILLHRAKLA